MTGPAVPPGAGEVRHWWERRWFVALLILISAVPLLYPEIPPLVDLLGHIGRYRVQLDVDTSPWLSNYFGFRWEAIGNLGVDLLIIPLAPVFGLELAVKLIVLSIPPLTVAGFLWVAREVHHRLPPTALFALPFVYGYPFHFGFANFSLSIAFAFLAFGLWLRLARFGRIGLRALLFVPISIVIFFTHTYGWGTLGLLCFSAEAVRIHDRGERWFKAGIKAALHASVMALPLLFMIAWRTGMNGGGLTFGWFRWWQKWEWIYSALRDSWRPFDIGALIIIALVVVLAVFSRRLTFSRNLAFSALVLIAAFLLLPWTVFGSAYADMRIVPSMMAVIVLAIRFREQTYVPMARILAIAGLTLFLVRIAGTTASLAIASNDQQAKLTALDHIPMGARVVTLTGQDCVRPWGLPRNSHLGGMVMARRHGFANNQWVTDGVNLLELLYRDAGAFGSDPSHIVRPDYCRVPPEWKISNVMAAFPREHFDFLWLIDTPPHDPEVTTGLQPVWRGPGSILYQVQP